MTSKKKTKKGEIKAEEPDVKLKKKVGKLEIKDYESISKLIDQTALKVHPQFSAAWSKWAEIKEKVEKKINQLYKRQDAPPKVKQPVKWKCLDCDEVHDKAEQIRRCPNCKSENLQKLTDYMAVPVKT